MLYPLSYEGLSLRTSDSLAHGGQGPCRGEVISLGLVLTADSCVNDYMSVVAAGEE